MGPDGVPHAEPRVLSRHDVYFAVAACATLAAAILTRAPGVASFDIIRSCTSLCAGVLICTLAIPLLALAPFVDRRGIASRAR